ncbi:ATP-dependent helicase [Corallococcus sp. ZKHCc1 1396]|uniref:ATP-dependent helicase n=1 Tax=Corallococcus soli TaxID=2710757 RepID=A0ABR9PZM5_9BACT|nr:UvrD-helicase domain-containing protein [Corallococcus soli]MBE4753372.1 ATP-dependent helicase [Corallococcus soli]
MTSRAGKPDTDADRELQKCLDAPLVKSFVMIAGAGSGKTTSLVKALNHLKKHRGVDLKRRGQRVACITYTEVAKKEILTDVDNEPLFCVSTIHSFLWTLIRPFQEDIRTWLAAHLVGESQDLEKPSVTKKQRRTLERDQKRLAKLRDQEVALRGVKRFTYGAGADYAKGILGHETIIKLAPALLLTSPLLRDLVTRQFPFVFVDESQDTNPEVVRALKAVASDAPGRFCLGFFGDPMQKIYATGVGEIEHRNDWALIKKPENFRSSANVLAVLNQIRAQSDGLEQKSGYIENRPQAPGTARLFVVPADDNRAGRLRAVRKWMADATGTPAWMQDTGDAGAHILVIVHRMAARRLGFEQVHAALNDKVPTSVSEGFRDGTTWIVRPFLSFILPLVDALRDKRDFDAISLLRTHCPCLSSEQLCGISVPELLLQLKKDTEALAALLDPAGVSSVQQVLTFIRDHQLMTLDNRFTHALEASEDLASDGETPDEVSEDGAAAAFLKCPVKQLWGYRKYIKDESPFFTQQGVKGAEFERVLTVVDDDEGSYNLFSYNKYFGVEELSAKDLANRNSGKETVIERTRRLFYVCCSRAIQDLAVVVFTRDVSGTALKIQQTGLFPREQVQVFEELL